MVLLVEEVSEPTDLAAVEHRLQVVLEDLLQAAVTVVFLEVLGMEVRQLGVEVEVEVVGMGEVVVANLAGNEMLPGAAVVDRAILLLTPVHCFRICRAKIPATVMFVLTISPVPTFRQPQCQLPSLHQPLRLKVVVVVVHVLPIPT